MAQTNGCVQVLALVRAFRAFRGNPIGSVVRPIGLGSGGPGSLR
jgi:hypothetical protein